MSLISEISAKDFDLDRFVQLALKDKNIRTELVDLMVNHADIMVYYHCYYVISKASQKKPELFYEFWDPIANLLFHKNSYHRNFALDIIGNLSKVDDEDRFSQVMERFFALINDEKFNTGNECIKNLKKIYLSKEKLRDKIVSMLLDLDRVCTYTEKQLAVLKSDVIDIFAEIYDDVGDHARIDAFIKDQLNSVSPKTRQKAKTLAEKLAM